MKKVLLMGASSFVGSNLATYLRKHYRVYGTYSTHPPRIDGVPCFKLVITPKAPLLELLNVMKPDAVVYCPARIHTPVEPKDSQEAVFLNAEAPAFLARAMDQRGGRFIYLSTSKVFSGEQGNYTEFDPVDPVGVYGMTKARAEELIMDVSTSFIFRLGTLFGLGSTFHSSLLNRLLLDLRSEKQIPYISDEYRTFYCVDDVAHAVAIAIDGSIDGAGLYHLSHPEKHTYYSFAKQLASVFGLSSDAIVPVSGATINSNLVQAAGPRGHDLTLKGGLFEEMFSTRSSNLNDSLLSIRNKLALGVQ